MSAVKSNAKSPYTGQASGNSVISLIEQITVDVSKLTADTTSAEDEAASAFENSRAEMETTVAVKEVEIRHKSEKRALLEDRAREEEKQLMYTHEELNEAIDVYDKLKDDCGTASESFQERKRAR